MKKKTFYLIPVIALLITACQTTKPKSSQIISSDEPDTSLVSSSSSISSDNLTSDKDSSSEPSSSSVSSSDPISSSSNPISSSSEPISSSSSSSSSSEPLEDNFVNLEIFALNDNHGTVKDGDSGLGISKTSTLLKTYPKNINNALYVSQGDMWQGGAESNATKGKLMTDWMNQLGFVSMTVGNHEFDWGTSYVSSNAALADFPFLGINVFDRVTNQRVDYLDPSVIVNKNGAKIGIIGSIGDCYSSIAPSMVSDIYFKVGSDLTNLVKNEATRLKNDEKCDFIIYSTHFSDENYDLTISDYVDIVFEGHSHENYIRTDAKGTYHIQSAGYNRTIGYIDLTINTTKDTFVINKINPIYTLDYSSYANDQAAESLFTKYANEINAVDEVIGYNIRQRNSTYLRRLVASLYLEEGIKSWGSEYNIFLAGGYLSCRDPYNLYEGNVKYADLYTLFPFDNPLVLCSVSGYYLESVFINSTNNNYYISYSDYGNDNQYSVDRYQTYYVVVDSYTSEYAPNHLTEIVRHNPLNYYARDMLAEYARNGGFEH